MTMGRRIAAMVLVFEALVALFGALVASQLSGLAQGTALAGGAALALACLVVAALLRFRWGYWLGSALQVVLIATGFVVPAMFFMGALFAALWLATLRIAARIQASADESGAGR
jgi:hypothetical protein